jgi:hypothetical protein
MDGSTLLDPNKVNWTCNIGGLLAVNIKPAAVVRSSSRMGGEIHISARQAVDVDGTVESIGTARQPS